MSREEKDRFWKSHTDPGNAMLRTKEPGWSYRRFEVGNGVTSGLQLCNYEPAPRLHYALGEGSFGPPVVYTINEASKVARVPLEESDPPPAY